MTAAEIIILLRSIRFNLQDEKQTQAAIAQEFDKAGMTTYLREHRFDEKNVVDFFVCNIAIEVKIKGSRREIFRQCERYCQFEEVQKLILITNRSMGFPEEINGKSCYLLNLGKAWL